MRIIFDTHQNLQGQEDCIIIGVPKEILTGETRVVQAQHVLQELAESLEKKGVSVLCHPSCC